ncbi:MAG TPA: HAD hydrolase family protein [Phycisphaerales bacterium]|nr:HAD hydrolase family protein [Phycisphaerales bacterium]HRQ76783.1 HAD hydrolase family protein [Phycisphaerales bacterium]
MADAAENVRLLCLDVDGVMTDGGVRLDDLGVETKRFHVRDGAGIRIWLKLGYEIAIITGRSGMAIHHRAAELGIHHVLQGLKHKREAFTSLLNTLDLRASEAAMLGDDLPDLPVMRLAGYPMAVADAAEEVRAAARFVTTRPGGHGAVREVIEHLLKSRGEWDRALKLFE